MARTKIVPLNINTGTKPVYQPIQCEVVRSKRKTLALYIKQQKLVVRCPRAASNAEVDEFIENNHDWIQERLQEERQLEQETLRIEKGAKIFYRARELIIVFKEGRKQRTLINGDKFIILPNPTDGHWVRAMFGTSEPEPNDENLMILQNFATRNAWDGK